jgi:hypothetical protein
MECKPLIDGMDFQTGVPHARIVSVHGTMGRGLLSFTLELNLSNSRTHS